MRLVIWCALSYFIRAMSNEYRSSHGNKTGGSPAGRNFSLCLSGASVKELRGYIALVSAKRDPLSDAFFSSFTHHWHYVAEGSVVETGSKHPQSHGVTLAFSGEPSIVEPVDILRGLCM